MTGSVGQPRRLGPGTRRITVVGDPDAPSLLALQYALVVAARHVAWSSAILIDDPGRAIVAFIDGPDGTALRALRDWSHRAWQPLTILSIAAGTANAWRDLLDSWSFQTIVGVGGPDWTGLRGRLESVLATDTWLVPLAADALGCHDPAVVHSLDVCLRTLPHRHTVTSWSRALGLRHRQMLHGLFAERNLPSPKCILDHLRLACVAHHGRDDQPRPDRTGLALRFGYSSADYLGKAVKRCLGCSLGELVAAGPGRALQPLRHLSRTGS